MSIGRWAENKRHVPLSGDVLTTGHIESFRFNRSICCKRVCRCRAAQPRQFLTEGLLADAMPKAIVRRCLDAVPTDTAKKHRYKPPTYSQKITTDCTEMVWFRAGDWQEIHDRTRCALFYTLRWRYSPYIRLSYAYIYDLTDQKQRR